MAAERPDQAWLETCGARFVGEALDELLRAINAAGDPSRPDWLCLIRDRPDAALDAALEARRAALRLPDSLKSPAPAERLDGLRAALAEKGLDGLLVPRVDAYRSEYLPAQAERLAWLTGFTGSAGFTVVLHERAAVFTDGRYTEQIGQQVDATRFTIRRLPDETPSAWLAEHAEAGARIGYDPHLFTEAALKPFQREAERRGCALVPLGANPIDALWQDRPPAPVWPISTWPLAHAGESSADKRVRMGREVAKAGADIAVIALADSIAWLLNIRGGDIPFNPLCLGFLLLEADGQATLFTDLRKLPVAARLDDAELEPLAAFETALAALGQAKRRVLIDAQSTNLAIIDRLRAAGAPLVRASDPCVLAKAVKNDTEIDGMRACHVRDGAALCRVLRWLDEEAARGGLSERDVAERLIFERAKDELFRGPSFDSICGFAAHAALPHYRLDDTSNAHISAGNVLLIDSGGQYLDGTTDITRTLAVGAVSDEIKARNTRVLRGHIALARAVFPEDTSGGQLDILARLPLWRAGLDYDHGTGHGIGAYLCVHEGPQRIAKRLSETRLRAGMILSNEPGYYKPNAYGIRIENLVLVVRAKPRGGSERAMLGFETLSLAPIDRRLILPGGLYADELAWLNDYHARVRETLSPHLDQATAAWLTDACAPIEHS
ncbi:MAG: aminopeptidase P family protein [Geminicoccaceae bacterium]